MYLSTQKTGYIQPNGRERIVIVAVQAGEVIASFPPHLNDNRVPTISAVRNMMRGSLMDLSIARLRKVTAVRRATGCSRDTAISYLIAEEWTVHDSILSYRAGAAYRGCLIS
ncbi:hypothetical protein CAL26_21270 [Bordetella genomosp. 9]|uniref:Uncharacterized protein n=1 Tax=Bordetella genomosp. 9 TaxID=1416803 RepID=A0A261R4Y4_9BORD|nr:hypothetical protein [Bordetella genomosp. 9]OZI20088.1 hypothetical protein CAL26_21270 [Bordetella genomosp. 9]